MATDTKLEMGFLDKLGEKFSNFGEGFGRVLTRVLGSSNERQVRALGYIPTRDPAKPFAIKPGSTVSKINDLEPKMAALSDAELKEQTQKFRERLKAGETIDALLPEAFAACREAGKRSKGMRHYDVQMIGGTILHRGAIAEMVTGEGKTLVATLPAYLNALSGEGVHVVTVNDYLARRDCEWMLPIYAALGLSAGYIQSDMDPVTRRSAYEADITYGTSSEFGFDYLRDNMKPNRFDDPHAHPYSRQCQRKLNYAIIDEVDNILIDESRTPLIISGPAHSDLTRYEQANGIVIQLIELERKAMAQEKQRRAEAGEPPEGLPPKQGEKPFLGFYYEIKEKERTCHLTDLGVRTAEELAGVESFYTAGNMEWPHLLDNALKAHLLYVRDRHYLVMPHPETREMSIIIVDEHTGRALFGRQWSDGLHQAVEAKHKRDGVVIKQENQTLATVTLQNYFRLYKKLGGMTGTAMTESDEFWKIYKLEVIAIPTNRFLKRINQADSVYLTEKEKWDAIVEETVRVHAEGRPILIGTTDVAKSEKLSNLLKRRGIKHELLNAKPENVARESEIVAQAGRKGAVTIATNMAGRGTDIILGGNPETLAWARLKDTYPTRLEVPEDVWKQTVDEIEARDRMKEAGREVAAIGGLHIIGTERHESRRIDNQLRGRAGRQGDPGSSRFYLSLQDDLMRLFGGEWVGKVLSRLGMQEGEAIESRMVSKRIQSAQKKVEEYHFEQRKNLLEYDEVMDVQRKRVYGKRQDILNDGNCKIELLTMIDAQIRAAVERFMDREYGAESFAAFASERLGVECEPSDVGGHNFEDAVEAVREKAVRYVPTVVQEAMDENLSQEDDPKDWKWLELTRVINAKYGLKLTDRQLKQIGRENLSTYLFDEATKAIQAIDLADGRKYLERDWGIESLVDWVRQKFLLEIPTSELAEKSDADTVQLIRERVDAQYRAKEIAFPVEAAMANYMADKAGPTGGAKRYDREGFYRWLRMRYPEHTAALDESEFRTEPRSRLEEIAREISAKAYPTTPQTAIDAHLEEAFSGTKLSDADDAKEMVEWMRTTYRIELDAIDLTGLTQTQARQRLWNAFDARYRPEMRSMERGLVLNHLDSSWKKHLLTMDHLRAGISLWSFAQVDPKTKYKQEGQKEFEGMWASLQDRTTDAVFRMEDVGEEEMTAAMWAGQAATQEAARTFVAEKARAAQAPPPDETVTNAGAEKKKIEPIRNMVPKVGRNDPCPCGSGKKYKNCHMKIDMPLG